MARERERAALHAQIKEYPGTYLHAVPLNDLAATHNLSLSGWLFSSEYAAVVDDGLWDAHTSIRDTAIEELAARGPVGVLTPFAILRVAAAAIIRSGGHVGVGALETAWLSGESERGVLHAGDVELAFERARREIAPNAASRLTSIFVADDTPEGRRHLESMFKKDVDRMIVRVRIPAALRVTRCDTRWFEDFYANGTDESLERYWSGDAYDQTAAWEYLVEGMIEVVAEKQLRKIDRAGAAPDLSAGRAKLRKKGQI